MQTVFLLERRWILRMSESLYEERAFTVRFTETIQDAKVTNRCTVERTVILVRIRWVSFASWNSKMAAANIYLKCRAFVNLQHLGNMNLSKNRVQWIAMQTIIVHIKVAIWYFLMIIVHMHDYIYIQVYINANLHTYIYSYIHTHTYKHT